MDELEFSGEVVNGIGRHRELILPGRQMLDDAPAEWPQVLFAGSLNVRISVYPTEFAKRGIAPTTKSFDTAGFVAAFTISQAAMGNNRLVPTRAMPLRGMAQVWKASLTASGQTVTCWVLRRFGSGLADQLELVSDESLRARLALARDRDCPARVVMQGFWRV